jgi:hypothetical protein
MSFRTKMGGIVRRSEEKTYKTGRSAMHIRKDFSPALITHSTPQVRNDIFLIFKRLVETRCIASLPV